MPFVISFIKQVEVADRQRYINDCCIGGDLVLDQLLPSLRERYGDLQSNQEDWGWFAWFEESGVKLAVDVFAGSVDVGQFQIHLTSRTPRFFGSKIEDTPELAALRSLVVSQLQQWSVADLEVEQVDTKYRPV